MPEILNHLGDGVGRGMADQERDDGERIEHFLEKRKLNLERVVPVHGRIVDLNLSEPERLLDPGRIDLDLSQRREESPCVVVTRPSIPGEWHVPSRTTRSILFDHGTSQA